MKPYQKEFIEFALAHKALMFGEFTLKSGRISPYFFNAGQFHTGSSLRKLGQFYAQVIVESQIEFDLLFGPAYKGIPLVTSVAIALAEQHGINKPLCFNRKEAKIYGEGGMTIGAPLTGKVLIVDDVISTGKTMDEVMPIICQSGASLAAVAISVDRQERGGRLDISATKEVRQKYGAPVISIVGLLDMMTYLEHQKEYEHSAHMRQYLEQYGAE